MAKRSTFYRFHFVNDVMRVQQIRNIGALEDNNPVSPNDWEEVKKKGNAAVERWIDDNMKCRQCVVVLIGSETANRPWVKYEIKKAWDEKRGLFGVYIHNLKCPRNGTCSRGANPFEGFSVGTSKLSNIVKCYEPSSYDAYGDIAKNMESWVESAIAQRK